MDLKQEPSEIRNEQRGWAKAGALEFFRKQRSRPEDLYPSERFFLTEVLAKVSSCLDVGCAAGGFGQIMKSFNPGLLYTGADVLPELVEAARRIHPDSTFVVSDGTSFPTHPDSFDLVFSSGVLHLNSQYREILRACYAQTRRYLLCDLRLTYGTGAMGTFRLDLGGGKDASDRLPYYVLNVVEAVELLGCLVPQPRMIHGYGYYHAPSPLASVPVSPVIMAFFLIEKGSGGDAPKVILDIPGEAA